MDTLPINIFKPLNMNVSKIKLFLIRQLAQCIIQSRVDLIKEQMVRFQRFIAEMGKHRHKTLQYLETQQLLSNLIITPKLQFPHQLQSTSPLQHNFLLVITLKKQSIESEVLAQIWDISVHQKQDRQTSDIEKMLLQLFEETLLLLNKQPLFSQYQKNSKIRQQYKMDYNIFIKNKNNENLLAQLKSYVSIVTIGHRYSRVRSARALEVEMHYYSLETLQNLDKNAHFCRKQQKWRICLGELIALNIEERTSHLVISGRETIDEEIREEENGFMQIQEEDDGFVMIQEEIPLQKYRSYRKMSLYEYHDTQLDMTVLSNDDKSFNSSPKHTFRQLQIQIQQQFFSHHPKHRTKSMNLPQEQDDHFQILDFSKDEKFLQMHRLLFEQFAHAEQKMYRYEHM